MLKYMIKIVYKVVDKEWRFRLSTMMMVLIMKVNFSKEEGMEKASSTTKTAMVESSMVTGKKVKLMGQAHCSMLAGTSLTVETGYKRCLMEEELFTMIHLV